MNVVHKTHNSILVSQYSKHGHEKMFWEDPIAYFPLIGTDRRENGAPTSLSYRGNIFSEILPRSGREM
jgi:hypothetical protein